MTDPLVAELYDVLADAVAAESRDELVTLLVYIRDLRADLAALAKAVECELMPLAGEKQFVVPNIGEVTIRKQTRRTGWKHDLLLPVLIARIMDEPETIFDRETGELLPYVQIGHNLTRRLRECVSFGAGKVTGLKAIGLDEEDFCTVTPDGYGVELPPRKDA